MTITVTGATGHFGRLVIDELLDRGVPPQDIVVTARVPERAASLASLGIEVRHADYGEPETLGAALEATDKLLLVSGTDFGHRVRQHRNVIEAAQETGVSLIAYTSISRADIPTFALAPDHRTTEQELIDSGVPYVLLRNNFYHENYTAALSVALEQGVILGSAGQGRISGAARIDYAAAAAVVLTTGDHEGRTYELAGDESFTKGDLATEVGQQSGKTVRYCDLSIDDYVRALSHAGVPRPLATLLAEVDAGIRAGLLHDESRALSRLIGRPTASLAESVAAALTGMTLGARPVS
jgi:NAD(P)H dehydrogenase (quinone)